MDSKYDSAPIDNIVFLMLFRRVSYKDDILVANVLTLNRLPYEKNTVFNEANINVLLIKLKPKSWLVILRIMLLLRLGEKDKSI